MKQLSVRRLAINAMCVAILVICAWLTIPAPIPFTMQTFAIFAVLGILGGRDGSICVLAYLLLGSFGLPVFSGFSGGVGTLFGPTGGYLLGFMIIALFFWLCERRFGKGDRVYIISCLIGLMLCYAVGTVWYVFVYLQKGMAAMGAALLTNVVPFIVPDVLKLVLALTVRWRLKRFTYYQ